MDGYVTIGTELDTKNFEKEIASLETKLNDIEATLQMASEDKTLFSTNEIREMEAEAEKLRNKLVGLKKKQSELGKSDFSQMKSSLSSIGSSVENVTKKISHWALAVFGIRSAINFIKSSISTLSQYDEQMGVNIEYIRYLLASTLKPVIETLIQLAYKLLVYINYISQAWFGINLFANASTKAFEKQHTAMKNTNKQAKELQKTLAGFDEMNILQKNGDVKSGGGGGGVSLPSFPKMEDIKIPSWLEWIVKNKNLILSIMGGITAGLLAWKLGLGGIKALGIGIAIFGIIRAIQSVIKFLKDPTFKNFIGILEGIAIAVAGVAIAFGAWPVAIGAAVALAVIEIVKYYDDIIKIFNNLIKWMDKNFLGALRYLFGPLGDIFYMPIKSFVLLAKGAFEGFYGGIKTVVNGVIRLFKGDFLGGIKNIFGGLLSIMTAPLQGWVKGVKGLWDQIKGALDTLVKNINNKISKINPINIGTNIGKGIGSVGNKIKDFFGFAKGGIVVPRLASGGIINNPGRGVPLGSAIGGERGAEGVIPLTDSQQMMLLGEAIGRYITINANITNTMNGRVISRELQKVQNENNFAFNR